MSATIKDYNQYLLGFNRAPASETPAFQAGPIAVLAELLAPAVGEPEPQNGQSIAPTPFCATEAHHAISSCLSLKLGWGSHGICRWKKDTVLTYNVLGDSFPTQEHLECALRALDTAAGQWNKVDVVTFQRVADDEPAVFQLVYKRDDPSGNLYARAFFPGEVSKKRKLRVYDLAFQKAPGFMSHIFCHELGHVLGLRHEFADMEERRLSCISYGPKDALSVMNNYGDDGLHKYTISYLDQEWTRKFYACDGTLVANFDEHFYGLHYRARFSIREIEVLHLIAPEDRPLVAE